MIQRVLVLYPAVEGFLRDHEQSNLRKHLLPNQELDILHDLIQVLEILHTVQELLSSERTPTL
ncbi:hypothetical protein HGRIS_001559 [Hohenbuehelia grisea]|uniref:Uncharacterized protein n=1 Tax=Hohenbuehelia grisea TaxID=104357 RepID=A0ABR3JR06_9AGAR